MKYLYKPNKSLKLYFMNIKTKLMTLVTYTSRCRKITLETVDFAYLFRWVKPRGSTIYLCLLATIINTLIKKTQNSSLKTPPQVNKKGK